MVAMICFFLSLLFTALALGPAFSHVLECPVSAASHRWSGWPYKDPVHLLRPNARDYRERRIPAPLVLAFLQGHNPVVAAMIAFAALCLAATASVAQTR
jgi:hypothetical protein